MNLFNQFCEKVKTAYDCEKRAAELKGAPYSKVEAKAFTQRLIEEKKAIYHQTILTFVKAVRGQQDVKRLNIPLNRGALKNVPNAPLSELDEHIYLGKHGDEYLKDILAAIEADPEENWGPSIPTREAEIARLEREAKSIREDLLFNFQKIGRSKWWPHERLTEDGCDRWLLDAGGPLAKAGDLKAVYSWLNSNEGNGFLSKGDDITENAI